eukprot:SAG31_NODE_4655_length_3066_cov_2.019211_4_plen_100_part_01
MELAPPIQVDCEEDACFRDEAAHVRKLNRSQHLNVFSSTSSLHASSRVLEAHSRVLRQVQCPMQDGEDLQDVMAPVAERTRSSAPFGELWGDLTSAQRHA